MKLKYSALVDDAAGKDGNLVTRRSRSGPTATPRVYPDRTRTVRNTAATKNLGDSATEFTNLTDSQIEAWNRWGGSRTKTNTLNGVKYRQAGVNAYVELTSVFKMCAPGQASPALPPTSSFSGGNLRFTVVAQPSKLIVVASGPLAADSAIEISVAPVASRARKLPKDGYVSQGFFVPEAADGYEMEVPLSASIYAVQVRYVNTATGQATVPQILGKATVALSVLEGGVDMETGEVVEPSAKPARMKKAA